MSRLPQRIATGVYQIALGGVNAFLIDVEDDGVGTAARAASGGTALGGLVLVDTGVARCAARRASARLFATSAARPATCARSWSRTCTAITRVHSRR